MIKMWKEERKEGREGGREGGRKEGRKGEMNFVSSSLSDWENGTASN